MHGRSKKKGRDAEREEESEHFPPKSLAKEQRKREKERGKESE